MSKIWLYAASSKILHEISDVIMIAKTCSCPKCGLEATTKNARVGKGNLLRLAIALLLITACGSVSAIVCKRFRDYRIELDDGEFEAFVAAHSNEVCFLGVNMYSQGSVYRSKYWDWVRDTGTNSISFVLKSGCRTCPVKLAHSISGYDEMTLTAERGNDAIVCLTVDELVRRKFAFGVEKHWAEKTAGEITVFTGIPTGIIDVQSNKLIRACGTNAMLRVLIESSPTQVYVGPSDRIFNPRPEDYRVQTSRRIIVTPLFKRKPKPIPKSVPKSVPKTSEMIEPEIEVDI